MIRLQNINLTSPEAIQRLANNHAIAVNLRDGFPYPYTIEDAITVCYKNMKVIITRSTGIVGYKIADERILITIKIIKQ